MAVISNICDFACLSVCLRALKAKRLKLLTPNLVYINCVAGSREALIPR